MAWGVLVGHEPMPVGRWLGFALIWLALLVFTGDALQAGPMSIGQRSNRHTGVKVTTTRGGSPCGTAC